MASLAVFFVVSFLAGPISLATYIRSMALLSEHESLKGMSLRHLCRLAWPGSEAIVPVLVVVVLLIAVVLLHRRGAPEQVLFVGCLSAGLALTPILWTHYLFIGLLALMVIRPEPVWTTAASAGTWFLVSAAHIPTIASLSLALRLTMLWLLILLLPALALTARSNRPVVISPDPDQELEALLLSAQRADADVVMS